MLPCMSWDGTLPGKWRRNSKSPVIKEQGATRQPGGGFSARVVEEKSIFLRNRNRQLPKHNQMAKHYCRDDECGQQDEREIEYCDG